MKTEPLVRKQIMLSNENMQKITHIAKEKKTSVAFIVRKAIDNYEPNPDKADTGLAELVELLNHKLDSAIKDTEETHRHLSKTLKNLSTRKTTI